LRRNGLQLQKLIDNLLGYSRAQAKLLPYRRSRLELGQLVEQAVADHRAMIIKKEIQLKLDLATLIIWGDSERLGIVIDNLLSNAVKFTPPGGDILVRIAEQSDQVLLEVCDSGPGIPEAERSKIYRPFYQANTPYVGPVKGTGLGLSIVMEYVRDHGGRLEQTSSSLGGACFQILLPRGEREIRP
jgi:two-component system sensor histidine kinase GlrK